LNPHATKRDVATLHGEYRDARLSRIGGWLCDDIKVRKDGLRLNLRHLKHVPFAGWDDLGFGTDVLPCAAFEAAEDGGVGGDFYLLFERAFATDEDACFAIA
jgi:hypothetical protein